MTDDKKIKEMLDRLVAMTPEPPELPEEVTMARHQPAKPRPKPALVFAAGAVLAAAVILPIVLLTARSPQDVIGSTLPAPSTTLPTAPSSTNPSPSTTMPAPSTTQVVASMWTGVIYLAQDPVSFLRNPALVPVAVEVTDPTGELDPAAPFTRAMALLATDALPDPYFSSIADGVDILAVDERSSGSQPVLVVEMSEEFVDGAGGLLADVTMLNQLVYTLTHGGRESHGVLFTVGGQPVVAYGTEGLDISDPIDRDTFIEDINYIFVTEPVVPIDGVFHIVGRSNTFEASLSVRVVDTQTGETTHEQFLTATCGSGCWGEFEAEIPADLIEPGRSRVEVLEYSAEDGSPNHLIGIPIPEDADAVWRLSAAD